CLAGQVAQQRSAMFRERFEVEHLGVDRIERVQQTALAGAGESTDDLETESRGQGFELRNDVPAPRSIASFELDGAPSDLVQKVNERAAALAAAPAIDDRRPAARLARDRTFEHRRDVARDDRRPRTLGGESRFLRVHRPDAGAFDIVQHRSVLGARDMILCKFRGRADVDAIQIRGELVDGDRAIVAPRLVRRIQVHRDFASNGESTGHTLSSSFACAAAVGWTRSGWNHSSDSPMPEKRNGTSGTWFDFATSPKRFC